MWASDKYALFLAVYTRAGHLKNMNALAYRFALHTGLTAKATTIRTAP